jgi:hypothetical protein
MADQSFKLGPAIKDGVLRFVSVSQIESFDPGVYGGCNRRWWFRRVAREKEDQQESAALGEQLHKKIEHYLKHGDLTVIEKSDIIMAGFRFLPRPGDDLLLEWEFGQLVGSDKYGSVVSPISLADVPVIGKADCAHDRQEWVTDDGDIVAEPGMVEIIDWKSTKRINDTKDASGRVFKGIAKSAEALSNTHQMRAYAALAVVRWPEAKSVRLSHGYFQTQWPRDAEKRSKLVDAAGAMDRFLSSTPLVEKMKLVATATAVTDVEPNYDACDAFRGCPHRKKCPRSPLSSVLSNIRIKDDTGVQHMSLIKKSKAPTEPVPAPTISVKDEEVAKEIENLKAEEAGIAPPDEPAPNNVAEVNPEVVTGCAAGKQIALTEKTTSYDCACGATVKVKPVELGGAWHTMVPKHAPGEKPAKKAAPVKRATDVVEPPRGEVATFLTFLLDASADNQAVRRLETYASEIAQALAESEGVVDIRSAPEKSGLSFGKWKGFFVAAVKENPPPPGMYAVSSSSELGMVAFEALLSRASLVIRGSR